MNTENSIAASANVSEPRDQIASQWKHTPGPWKYAVNVGPTRAVLVQSDGSTILSLDNNRKDSRFEANVRRIVACVNACEGLSNDELSDMKARLAFATESINSLREELELHRER